MRDKLHVGKLDKSIETSVTEAFSEWIVVRAHALGLPKAEFIRDLLYIAATTETYTFHVAKDKAKAFKSQMEEVRETPGNCPVLERSKPE